jgi:long-chain fatty acid transport protein
MVTEICVSAVFRVIVALRIRLLIFLLQGGYIPVDRSGQAPIQTFVFKTNISYDSSKETAFAAAAWALGGGGAQSLTGDYDTEVSRPESLKINVQSGIAADTLLFASYHRAKWSGAPVLVDVTSAAGGLVDPKIDETFDDSEKFSIGVGCKFSERLSGSLSYSKEEDIGADATSLFTFSNGTKTIIAGLRNTIDNMNISVGVSRSTLSDITVDGGLPNGDIVYKGNSVTAVGVKIAFVF